MGDYMKNDKRILTRTKKRNLFYTLMMCFPVLQFLVFYVYINLNTVILAFQQYSIAGTEGYLVEFARFKNFISIFEFFATAEAISMFSNSIMVYVIHLLIGSTLALFFSYYIYKKYLLHGIFKVFLFMPQILSAVVLALLFKYIATDAYIELFGARFGLLDDPSTRMFALTFFSVWVSFGSNILIYSGAMSGINESIAESAELEGVNPLQEFWFITLPMIFPTFITFFVAGLAGAFSNQFNLYTIYENNAPMETVGYFLYTQSAHSALVPQVNPTTHKPYLSYSEIAAFGLIITLFVAPVTLVLRKILTKYGPNPN